MQTENNKTAKDLLTRNSIELMIRLGFLLILVWACVQILAPFILPIVWGLIIAIAISPLHARLKGWLGGRNKLSATLITLVFIATLIAPAIMLTASMMDGINVIRAYIEQHGVRVPPPPESISEWPLIGQWVSDTWQQASTNIESLLVSYAPQLKGAAAWLLSSLAGAGLGTLFIIISFIISGIFLATSESGSKAAYALGTRLIGDRGKEFVDMTTVTVRNVAVGILGVAIVQATLAGVGFVIAGIPFAGLWAVICMLLAIIQVGVAPIVIPTIIYLYSTTDTVTATLLTVYFVFVLLVDNFLKPILLGRKAPVPMPVVFLGSIGGFIAYGIVGLFIGAVILSLGYRLYLMWLYLDEEIPSVTASNQ